MKKPGLVVAGSKLLQWIAYPPGDSSGFFYNPGFFCANLYVYAEMF